MLIYTKYTPQCIPLLMGVYIFQSKLQQKKKTQVKIDSITSADKPKKKKKHQKCKQANKMF